MAHINSMMDSIIHIENELVSLIKKVKLIAFDFDGVFTDNAVYVDQHGVEAVRCNRSDGIGLAKLRKYDIHLWIISTEPNPVVLERAKKLKIACKNDCKDKKRELKRITKKLKLSFDQVAFIGNDVNDEECLRCVGFPIVVKDAHPDVKNFGKYISKAKGGHGAVREICDLFDRVINS